MLFYVLLENPFTYMETPQLPQNLDRKTFRTWGYLYRATSAATRNIGFCGLIRRIAVLKSLVTTKIGY